MKASPTFLAVAIASIAFGCDKPAAPAADGVSEQTATLAAPAPSRDVGSLQGKVAGAAATVQFGLAFLL